MTQFHIKSGRWMSRRDILDDLGKRRKSFLKGFTNMYLFHKEIYFNKNEKVDRLKVFIPFYCYIASLFNALK